jgi:hypothetical protein
MSNPFSGRALPLSGPATDIVPVTPDDGLDLEEAAVALYVETGGSLRLTTVRGVVRELTVPDACLLPVGALRVHATGSTASGIYALMV